MLHLLEGSLERRRSGIVALLEIVEGLKNEGEEMTEEIDYQCI